MRRFEYVVNVPEFINDPDVQSKDRFEPFVLVMDTATGVVYTGDQYYKDQFLTDDVSNFLGAKNE